MFADDSNRRCNDSIAMPISVVDVMQITCGQYISSSLAFRGSPSQSVSNNEALLFTGDPDASFVALSNHKLVLKVFVRYSTALLSSAHIEQVFSVAADVLK